MAKKCLVSNDCEKCQLKDCVPLYSCIYCESINIIRYGHNYKRTQNWYCKSCHHKFIGSDHIVKMHYEKEVIIDVINLLQSGLGEFRVARAINKEYGINISPSTIHRWKHKFLNKGVKNGFD